MSIDYKIYVKAEGGIGGEKEKPTQPKKTSNKKTKPDASGIIGQVGEYIVNPDALISKGISSSTKAIVGVAGGAVIAFAVASAAIKIGDKVADIAISFNSRATGDYRAQTSYGNFKATMTALFSPFQTGLNILAQRQMYEIESQRKEQERALLGDSLINSYNRSRNL